MHPCPNCGQEVLQMADKCRFCGAELDDETFCLNEGQMVEEIMALQREAEAKETKRSQLNKAVKTRSALAVICLLPGGYLSLATQGVAGKVGFALIVVSVALAMWALKALKELRALS